MPKTSGIYKITNTITNESYIGQSKNIEKRIATHKEDLENGTHVNKGLQEDYNLAKTLNPDYEIFTFEIIKEAKAKDLNKEEMYWINEFNTFERGYNRTSGGIHDETKGHVDYGGGRLFADEKRKKLIEKELTDDFDNKENYIFKTTSNDVLCPECGNEFNDEFEFCPYCGNKKPQPKICPKCKLEPSLEFGFCPKCGTELVEKEGYLKQLERKRIEQDNYTVLEENSSNREHSNQKRRSEYAKHDSFYHGYNQTPEERNDKYKENYSHKEEKIENNKRFYGDRFYGDETTKNFKIPQPYKLPDNYDELKVKKAIQKKSSNKSEDKSEDKILIFLFVVLLICFIYLLIQTINN